ncbi:lactate utilization protein [Methanoregula sp.]|uniref:lactate utilization protein n=1 Tax=Methanoregula sp. TaxID=2052170 RepID=UPI003BB0BFA1
MSRTTPFSAVNLYQDVAVDAETWNHFPDTDVVDITVQAIKKRGIKVILAADGDEALAVIRKLIPSGSEVMSGSSTTLIEIGFEDYVARGTSGWILLHTKINAEDDPVKRAEIRRKSVTADYFISSANAIAQTGEIVSCDATGSRVGAWPYAAGHLILVAGINKIVPTVEDALQRIRTYVFPLENVRAMKAYGTQSMIGKCVILANEKQEGRITLILVSESLGY